MRLLMCGGTQTIADAPVVFLSQNEYKGNFSWNRFHEKIFHTIFDLNIFFVPLPDPTKKRFANVAALPNDVSLYRIQKLDLSNVKAADG